MMQKAEVTGPVRVRGEPFVPIVNAVQKRVLTLSVPFVDKVSTELLP